MDVIEVIFKDFTKQQKKNIAFGQHCIRKCTFFIKKDQWNLLDSFINCTLSSEDDISELKQRLIQDTGKEITIFFLKRREFKKMNHFMNWAFKSDEEISNYCQSLDIQLPSLCES